VNGKPKGRSKAIGTGCCPFCDASLALSVSKSGVRIFRCSDCGLYGQSTTPPRRFRARPRELRRERRLWHVAN
jgi:hypothetical protein